MQNQVDTSLKIYELLRERWRKFCRKFNDQNCSTNAGANFSSEATSLTSDMDWEFKFKMWDHQLKKSGMRLVYFIRDADKNQYAAMAAIQDPGEMISGHWVEISHELALKIVTLEYIP